MTCSKDGRFPSMNREFGPARAGLLLGGAVLFLSALVSPASADSYSVQPRQAAVTTSRTPQEFAPVGIRMGVFDLMPVLDVTETYSDNIYRTQTGKKDDFITTISPQVQLKSDWARHELDFLASADVLKYANHDAENHENLNLAGDGRVDITKDMNAYAGVAYHQLYEDRGSPNDTSGLHPQKYNLASTNVGFFNAFNRLSVRLDARADQYTYADLATSTGITREVDRNRLDTQGTARLGYDTLTGWEPFVRFNAINSDYRTARDRNGFNKDSNGYEVDVGTAMSLSGIWAGEAFVGYLEREFDDARLAKVEDPTFGVTLTANATPLTSVNFIVNRTIGDSITSGTSSLTNTFYGVSADTEVMRNLVLGAGANLNHTDYNGISRQDDVTTLGTRARYFISTNFSLGPEISYVTRDAQQSGGQNDYQNWIFLLRLSGKI